MLRISKRAQKKVDLSRLWEDLAQPRVSLEPRKEPVSQLIFRVWTRVRNRLTLRSSTVWTRRFLIWKTQDIKSAKLQSWWPQQPRTATRSKRCKSWPHLESSPPLSTLPTTSSMVCMRSQLRSQITRAFPNVSSSFHLPQRCSLSEELSTLQARQAMWLQVWALHSLWRSRHQVSLTSTMSSHSSQRRTLSSYHWELVVNPHKSILSTQWTAWTHGSVIESTWPSDASIKVVTVASSSSVIRMRMILNKQMQTPSE